jgi:hypothetical protein
LGNLALVNWFFNGQPLPTSASGIGSLLGCIISTFGFGGASGWIVAKLTWKCCGKSLRAAMAGFVLGAAGIFSLAALGNARIDRARASTAPSVKGDAPQGGATPFDHLPDASAPAGKIDQYAAQLQSPASAPPAAPRIPQPPPGFVLDPAPPASGAPDPADHARVVQAVSELHLQSIVHGGKYRACMINNTLYREGQQSGIFTVQQIDYEAGTVVVECGRYRFELKMQK